MEKSTIEIETTDAHELSQVMKIISGYLERRKVPYNVLVGNERLASIRIGGD